METQENSTTKITSQQTSDILVIEVPK